MISSLGKILIRILLTGPLWPLGKSVTVSFFMLIKFNRILDYFRDYSFSTYAEFSEKLTYHEHVSVRIRD